MARYTDDSRERVRDAVDFAELVGARTELRRAGVARLEGLCPFHDERSPSFGINPVEKVYYCFGCGAGGDVFKFVMETENLNFGQALESLAERYRVTLEREAEDPKDAENGSGASGCWRCWSGPPPTTCACCGSRRSGACSRVPLGAGAGGGGAARLPRRFRAAAWDRVVNGSRRAGYSEDELIAAGLAHALPRGTRLSIASAADHVPAGRRRGPRAGFGARAMTPDDKPKYLNTSESELFHKGRIVYGADLARAAAARTGPGRAGRGLHGRDRAASGRRAGGRRADGHGADRGAGGRDRQAGPEGAVLPGPGPRRAGVGGEGHRGAACAQRGAARRGGRVPDRAPAGGEDPATSRSVGPDGDCAPCSSRVEIERFEVERALAQTGGSKDEMLATVAPIISTMGATILRDELVALVADRFGMTPNLVNEALRQPFTTVRRDDLRGGGQTRPRRQPATLGLVSAAATPARPAAATRGAALDAAAKRCVAAGRCAAPGGARRRTRVRRRRAVCAAQGSAPSDGGAPPRGGARTQAGAPSDEGAPPPGRRAFPGGRAAARGTILDPARSAAGTVGSARRAAARGGARLRASGAGRLRRPAAARVGWLLGRGRGIRRRGDGATRGFLRGG